MSWRLGGLYILTILCGSLPKVSCSTAFFVGGPLLACSASQDTYEIDLILATTEATRFANYSQLKLIFSFPPALQLLIPRDQVGNLVSQVTWNNVKVGFTSQYTDRLTISITFSQNQLKPGSNRLSVQTLRRLGAPFGVGTFGGSYSITDLSGVSLDASSFSIISLQNLLQVQNMTFSNGLETSQNKNLPGGVSGCLNISIASNCDYMLADGYLKMSSTSFYPDWDSQTIDHSYGTSTFSNPTGLAYRIVNLKSANNQTVMHASLPDGIGLLSAGTTVFGLSGPSVAHLLICKVWTQPFVGPYCQFNLALTDSPGSTAKPVAIGNGCTVVSQASGFRSLSITSGREWNIYSLYNLTIDIVSGMPTLNTSLWRVRFLKDIFQDNGNPFDPSKLKFEIVTSSVSVVSPTELNITRDETGAQCLEFKNLSYSPNIDAQGTAQTVLRISVWDINTPERPVKFDSLKQVVRVQVWDNIGRLFLDSWSPSLLTQEPRVELAFNSIVGRTVFHNASLVRGRPFEKEVCLTVPSKIAQSQGVRVKGFLPRGLGPDIAISLMRGFHPEAHIDLSNSGNNDISFNVNRDNLLLFEAQEGTGTSEDTTACLNVSGTISSDATSIGRLILSLATLDNIELINDVSDNWADFQPVKVEIQSVLIPADDSGSVGSYRLSISLKTTEVPPSSLDLKVEFSNEYLTFHKNQSVPFHGCAEVNKDRQGQLVCDSYNTNGVSTLQLKNIRMLDSVSSSPPRLGEVQSHISAEVLVHGLQPSNNEWVAGTYSVSISPEGGFWVGSATLLNLPVGCPSNCRRCGLYDRTMCLVCLEGYYHSPWTYTCYTTIDRQRLVNKLRIILGIFGSTCLAASLIYLLQVLRAQAGQLTRDYLDEQNKDYILVFTDLKVLTSTFGSVLMPGYLLLSITALNIHMIVISSVCVFIVTTLNFVWSVLLFKQQAKIPFLMRLYILLIHHSAVLTHIRRLGNLRNVEYLQSLYLNKHLLDKKVKSETDGQTGSNAHPQTSFQERRVGEELNSSELNGPSCSSANLLPSGEQTASYSSSVLELQHLAYQSGVVSQESMKQEACSISFHMYNKIRTVNMHARLFFIAGLTVLSFLTLTGLVRAELYFEVWLYSLAEWGSYTVKLNRVKRKLTSNKKTYLQDSQTKDGQDHSNNSVNHSSGAQLPNCSQGVSISQLVALREATIKPESLKKSNLSPVFVNSESPKQPKSSGQKGKSELLVSTTPQTQLLLANWDSVRPVVCEQPQREGHDDPEMY